ncbi:MAG: PEP-CTERM sorting domain-containing protein [Candidatus Rokubacteria bacterium]|nr:PEP-CTERM sorting domain-containing protein [Candidatus Rokubacteria bacterium]
MNRRVLMAVLAAVLIAGSAGYLEAASFSFTASDVKTAMAAAGAPLNDATNQWGLWAVRAMPVVGGTGVYTIDSGATTQTGWGVDAPNGAFGAAPYTPSNHVWFWDACGAEDPACTANPLYMIMDKPANTFESYKFDPPGTFTGTCTSSAETGCNLVTAVDDGSLFTVNFTLGPGGTWDGVWQFVVDGSKYTAGSSSTPGVWVADFFGGYDFGLPGGPGGGLTGNMAEGYVVTPEPTTLLLWGTSALGLAVVRRWRNRRAV